LYYYFLREEKRREQLEGGREKKKKKKKKKEKKKPVRSIIGSLQKEGWNLRARRKRKKCQLVLAVLCCAVL
jgi:hypothetical protein